MPAFDLAPDTPWEEHEDIVDFSLGFHDHLLEAHAALGIAEWEHELALPPSTAHVVEVEHTYQLGPHLRVRTVRVIRSGTPRVPD